MIDTNNTPEAIGEAIAQHFKWDGARIVECMLAALTEANFHTLAAEVDALYQGDAK
jgi:hypothetical protein